MPMKKIPMFNIMLDTTDIVYTISPDKITVTIDTTTQTVLVIQDVANDMATQEAAIVSEEVKTQQKIDSLATKENERLAAILEPLNDNLAELEAIKQACVSANAWPK